jgi:hypothetical protein
MNAYSIIHNYENKELYTPDFDFVQAVLSYKQQGYDINKAKIQNAYDQNSLLKVAKGVDQEYIDARLKEVANISNRYTGMDLSDNNFAASITSNINQVLDEKVQNAVISTKSMQAEDNYIESLKGSDKYSEKSHQYALAKSDRQRYLNSTEAGDRYRAGLDYREYRDVRGKLMKTMPALTKMFYDQSKEMGQGTGAGGFTTWNTYQGVEKDKVRNAILSQLDDKDRAYLEVEAWSEYDRLPDDYIREEYNGKISNQLSDIKREVRGFETAIAGLKDSDPRKAQYQEWLTSSKEKQLALEEGDYDNVLSKYGTGARSRLYNALYQDKLVDGFAETFKEDRKLVDIELDKANEANINYNFKVAQENQDQANWEKDYGLRVLKLNNDINKNTAKGNGKDKDGQRNTGDQDGIYDIKLEKTAYTDDQAALVRLQEQEKTAISGFNDIFGMRPGIGNLPKLKKEFANLAEKRANGGTINFNGKEVNVKKLNSEQYKKLLDFNNLVVEDHPIKKKYEDIAYGGLQEQISNLTRLVDANSGQSKRGREGDSFNIYDLPRMTGKFDKNGKWVPIEDPNNDHHYVRLLKKNAKGELDWWDKATLETYSAMHIAEDNILRPEEAQTVIKAVKSKLISSGQIAGNEINKSGFGSPKAKSGVETKVVYHPKEKSKYFADQNKLSEGRSGDIYQKPIADGLKTLDFLYLKLQTNPGDSELLQKIEAQKKNLKNMKASSGYSTFGQDNYLSELNVWDRDYTLNDKTMYVKDFGSIWKDTRNQMKSADNEYNKITKQEMEYYSSVILPSSSIYAQVSGGISSMMDNFKPDPKQAISAAPVDADGNISSDYVTVTVKSSSGKAFPKTITAKEAQKLGLDFVKPERTTYDARFGGSASRLDLGSGNVSKGFYEDDIVAENFQSIYVQNGLTPQMEDVLRAYKTGNVNVVLEANRETELYDAVIYKNGKAVGKVPTTVQKMYSQDIDAVSQIAGRQASYYVDAYLQRELQKEQLFKVRTEGEQIFQNY